MHILVNWSTVCFAAILLALAAVAAVTYAFLETRRMAAADRRQRRLFEREMASVRLPEWNGETYEWTPESLAYLSDPYPTGEMSVMNEPVPPSTISGPLPVMDEAGDFISRLRADNAEFLARLEQL
jgi:hypothetical protein